MTKNLRESLKMRAGSSRMQCCHAGKYFRINEIHSTRFQVTLELCEA